MTPQTPLNTPSNLNPVLRRAPATLTLENAAGSLLFPARCSAAYLQGEQLQRSRLVNRPGVAGAVLQLDGVGPVDNRPSPD